MKIIKLLLLLTFGLWADFKLDVPNDVNVSQLENIVNNGWKLGFTQIGLLTR